MLDTLDGHKPVCQPLQPGCPALEHDGFQTIAVVQVYMLAGDDVIGVIVLNVEKPVDHAPFVMIVDNDDDPGDLAVLTTGFFHQRAPDEEPDGLASVGKLVLGGEPVELFQEIFFKRDAEPSDLHHTTSLEKLSHECA